MSPLVPARRGAALASAAASRLSRPPVRPSRYGGPPRLDGAASFGRPVSSAPAASSGVSRPPPFEGPDRAGAPRACQARTLATSRQRRAAAAASRSEDGARGAPSASSDSDATSQQSRHPLAGKRPGETGFSPPADKLRSPDGGVGRGQGAGAGPLVVPSGIPPPAAGGGDGSGDNRGHAHLQPTSSLLDGGDGVDGALRSHFLSQGIIPSPRVDSSRLPPDELRRIRDPSSPPPCVPPPDPRGVSSANPEDVIDMATLYDPSVHLPDKPDFSSASNRERYEGGTPLTDELVAYIGVRGPITTAEFMRRALRHEDHGYYTGKGARAGGAPARSVGAGAGAAGEVDDGFEEDDNDWDLDDDSDDYAGIRSDGSSRAAGGDRVIGRSGDFITAPEISQLFGESLLVWFMTQYAAMGRPSRAQLIEIGPGRGTLVCDMVRSAVERFPDLSEALANGAGGVGVHLVEVTNGMRARQRMALEDLAGESIMVEKGYSFDFPGDEGAGKSESSDGDDSSDEPSPPPSAAEGKRSISVTWHDTHGSVPSKDADGAPVPTFVVCQELVDALPVHSFQKTEEGVWRERLVDVAVRDEEEAEAEAARVGGGVAAAAARAKGRYASAEGAERVRSSFAGAAESAPRTGGTAAAAGAKKGDRLPRLRFVLPPDTTPAVRTLLRVDATGRPLPDNPAADALDALPPGSVVEACPEGLLLAQDIARRIDDCGGRGAALVVDYGGDGSGGGDTLRGFARHRQVHPLSRPGEVDVTADVDFGALREAVNRRVSAQESFERFRRRQSGGIAGASADVKPAPPGEGTAPSGSSIKTEAYGPITQGRFLAAMGIVERVERRIELDSTTDDEAAELVSSLERLMDPDEMGERYKVMAIAPGRKDGLFPPPAF